MYETLQGKIETTLGNVPLVKSYFSYPAESLPAFPCVFFKPNGLENSFETSNENMKLYRYIMIVMVGVEQTTMESAFTVLQKVVDDIVAQFDSEWDGGVVSGHRIWVKINGAEPWEVSDEKEGLVAYAPLNLEIKTLTNN